MTTNQIIALAFPLLTGAATVLIAMLIRKLWISKRGEAILTESYANTSLSPAKDLDSDLAEADRIIQRVRGRIAAQ